MAKEAEQKPFKLEYSKEDGGLYLMAFGNKKYGDWNEDSPSVASAEWENDGATGEWSWDKKRFGTGVKAIISAGLCKVPRLPKKIKEALGL